jgi:DNA-binding CsgD family transcriptional regulator
VNSTHNYQCTICGYKEGIIVQLPFDYSICLGCMGLAIGKLQNAVYNHRPTNTNMQTAIDDAVRPLAERIATLELEMSAIRQAIDGRQRAGVLPYTKTKTEAAREMLVAGRSNKEVGTALGLDLAQVKQIKYRLKKRR